MTVARKFLATVEADGDSPEVIEFDEEGLDLVAWAVEGLIYGALDLAVALCRDGGPRRPAI